MADPTQKTCTKCGALKPISNFGRKASNRDGYQARCRPCIKVDKAESWQRNRERGIAKSRARYRANREAHIASVAAWKKAHPEKVRAYSRTWRERNPGRDLEDTRRWIAANPERAAENFRRNTAKRRARKMGAAIGPVDLDALWTGVCAICAGILDRSLAYPDPLSPSVDHIVPLSIGGSHEQANLQWSHLVCNIRKGAKAP